MKTYRVKVNDKVYDVEVEEVTSETKKETPVTKEEPAEHHNHREIHAPLSGKVLEVLVKKGQRVRKEQTVCIIEAMKLENEIRSAYDGIVSEVLIAEGDEVKNKDLMITLE